MTDKTTLGDRMKEYEATTQGALLRRTPVIIRIDGRAFHTFTKRLVPYEEKTAALMGIADRFVVDTSLQQSPFSEIMHNSMVDTAAVLLNNIQNCVLAYTQSDEISLLLRDWDKHETQQWFGGNVQKIVSISASIATVAFNSKFQNRAIVSFDYWGDYAQFDARVYNVPKEEVVNYFIWRQQDASRNSVQMLGRFFFSQKEMHGKNNSEVQDMLMLQKGINWNDIDVWKKRGSCVYNDPKWNMFSSGSRAMADDNIPIFTQDRTFIEKHLQAPENDVLEEATIGYAAQGIKVI